MDEFFVPVERQSAPEIVTQRLKKAILSGDIPKGTKLPAERDLATQMRVSRPVIREAMVRLSSYGLITSKQGEGNFVSDKFSENILEFMGFSNTLTAENYNYFFDCRLLLECGMVKQIIEYADEKSIAHLEQINQAFREQVTEEQYVAAEVEFHHAFLGLSDNPLVVELYTLVLKFMQVSASYLLSQEPIREEAYAAHAQIIDALRQKDVQACVKAVKNHLKISRSNLRAYFEAKIVG